MHNITQGLLDAGHQVKVMCISTQRFPLRVRDLPKEYRDSTRIEGVFVDTTLNIVDAFTDLITADNYNISRFFSPDMDIRLNQLFASEEFDVIHLESVYMTPYLPTIRRYTRAPIILRPHTLEHVIQERFAEVERNIIRRSYRRFTAKQLKDYEGSVLKQVDGVTAITAADAHHMKELSPSTPVVTIPFGLYPDQYQYSQPTGEPIFFHLGSMDWLPNEEGVRWLLRQVWPKVIEAYPDAKLHLAGNRMSRTMVRAHFPGTTVMGQVKDAKEYMAKRHVMLVPLFSAGGMRVKIIEGMALGKCVISTPIGAEGVECTDNENILIGKNAAGFVEQVIRVINEPGLAERIGRNGRQLVVDHYDNARIIDQLVAFYASLIAR